MGTRRQFLGLCGLSLLTGCAEGSRPTGPDTSAARGATRSAMPLDRPMINVRAQGDGRSDDTRAIQSALYAVPPEGGHVYFPAGVYRISKTSTDHFLTFKPSTTISGAGMRSSTIQPLDAVGDWVDMLRMSSPHEDPRSLVLADIGFDANTVGNPIIASPLTTARHRNVLTTAGGARPSITVLRCRFHDCSNVNTLYLAGGTVDVRDCVFTATGARSRIGWDHSSIYAVARDSGSIRIESNTFQGTRGSGGSRTAIETHGGTQAVRDNYVSDYVTGMNITGIADVNTNAVAVSNNVVTHAMVPFHLWAGPYGEPEVGRVAFSAVTVESNRATVDNSAWLVTPQVANAYSCGILLEINNASHMDDIALLGNTITYLGTNAGTAARDKWAAAVTLLGGGTVNRLRIEDNFFTDPPSTGVLLSSIADQVTIRGNTFVNPANSIVSPMDPALRSMVTLAGRVRDIVIERNTAKDSRSTAVIRQGVGGLPSLVLSGSSRFQDNRISCRDGTVVGQASLFVVNKLRGQQPEAPR